MQMEEKEQLKKQREIEQKNYNLIQNEYKAI